LVAPDVLGISPPEHDCTARAAASAVGIKKQFRRWNDDFLMGLLLSW